MYYMDTGEAVVTSNEVANYFDGPHKACRRTEGQPCIGNCILNM